MTKENTSEDTTSTKNELTRTREVLAHLLNKLNISPTYVDAVVFTDINDADDLIEQLTVNADELEAFKIKQAKFALTKETAIKIMNLKLKSEKMMLPTNKGDVDLGEKWSDDQRVLNSILFIKD